MVMLNAAFHSPYNARAMNYLEVYTISRDRLFELAEDYPASKKAMRREALFMAMRRALCDLVAETKKTGTGLPAQSNRRTARTII